MSGDQSMHVSRQQVVRALRIAGLEREADKADHCLPDELDLERASHVLQRHGITNDMLIGIARNTSGPKKPMHHIGNELDLDPWVEAGMARLERYLTSWRRFSELYPADEP